MKNNRSQNKLNNWFSNLKAVALVVIFGFLFNGLTIGQVNRYKAVIVYKDAFNQNSNISLINNVKAKGFNTVFLKVEQHYGGEPDLQNLGLKQSETYRNKVVDFCHVADSLKVKVFAFILEYHTDPETWEDPDSCVQDGVERSLDRMWKIAYYQKHVRSTPNHLGYWDKNAHFHGVVTNLEPWALHNWRKGDSGHMCSSSDRAINDSILRNQLDLTAQLYEVMEDSGFFMPEYDTNNYSLQDLDNIYMGTVHWNWHYFSQFDPDSFPHGNFNKWVGVHNINGQDKHYFDIIMPETYCPQKGNTCMSKDCVDNTVVTLCTTDTSYENQEAVGQCYDWFEKHYFTDDMFLSSHTIPIDAAPILVGHGWHMFDTWVDMRMVMHETYYRQVNCFLESNYRGYFAFHYDSLMAIPHGLGAYQPIYCGGGAIDKSMTDTTNINVREILLYPNPADKVINLRGLWDGDQSIIYDMNQNIHIISQEKTIDVHMLKPDQYVLCVVDKNGKIVNRQIFLIKRIY